MPHFLIRITEPGQPEIARQVEGRKFTHYIGGVRDWYGHHVEGGILTVTHIETGMRVCTVPYMARIAGVGMKDKDLCKNALVKLESNRGAERIRAAIKAAEADLAPLSSLPVAMSGPSA